MNFLFTSLIISILLTYREITFSLDTGMHYLFGHVINQAIKRGPFLVSINELYKNCTANVEIQAKSANVWNQNRKAIRWITSNLTANSYLENYYSSFFAETTTFGIFYLAKLGFYCIFFSKYTFYLLCQDVFKKKKKITFF